VLRRHISAGERALKEEGCADDVCILARD